MLYVLVVLGKNVNTHLELKRTSGLVKKLEVCAFCSQLLWETYLQCCSLLFTSDGRDGRLKSEDNYKTWDMREKILIDLYFSLLIFIFYLYDDMSCFGWLGVKMRC
jgi:hypothetical protein